MTEAASPRVALLGRQGPARDHLRSALSNLGGEITIEGEPRELDPDKVLQSRPSVVVVSLDAEIEDQLEAWDVLFEADGLNVIFDEAEVTGRLDGWDLARWARHLAAKILGHDQTLPPPPEGAPVASGGDQWVPAPGAPATPEAQMRDARLEDYAAEAPGLMDSVPEGQPAGGEAVADAYGADNGQDFSWSPEHEDSGAPAVEGLDEAFQALLAQHDAASVDTPASGETLEPDAPRTPDPDEADVAPSAHEAAQDAQHYTFGRELSLVDHDEDDGNDASAPAAGSSATAPTLSFDALAAAFELEGTDDDEEDEVAVDAGPGPAGREGVRHRGLVVLLAGMGGPDALRQLLSALPSPIPVPVVVWQQLNAGTHERLASQLAKTGKVETYVAQPGGEMPAGKVGILPPGVGVSAADGLGFIDDADSPNGLLQRLAPLGDRAVVVALSGSDAAWLDGATQWGVNGGRVLVQSPDTCFDATACQALAAAGHHAAAPADLAIRAMGKWHEDI